MHRPGTAGQEAVVNSNPPPAAGAYGGAPGPWRPERSTAIIVAAVVFVVVLVIVGAIVQALGPGLPGEPGPPGNERNVSVSAGPMNTVDLQGVPGQISIAGTSGDQVRLTGTLRWAGQPPSGRESTDVAASVLHLSYRCAAGSPCTEDYRLYVPDHTAVVLDQPSGHVAVSGLAEALRITAASADITATGLRSPSLVATITSGHLSAAFAAAPRKVDVTLTSSQATLRLPASTSYAVSQQVTSGSVSVGVPQASGASRTVTARVVSGDLELLPGPPS
jgi:hypothetical protein